MRIYLHGQLGGGTKWVEALPFVSILLDRVENVINGFIDDTNITPKGITAASLADATVTGAKIAAATVTSSNTADGVGQTASGVFTGDGVTANRIIAVGFTPRWVQIIPTTGTLAEYVAIAVGATTYYWQRSNTGAQTSDATVWQGIVTNGFKLGTNAAGTANTAAVVYAYVCWK